MLLGRAIPYCTLSLPRGLLIDICDSWVHKIPKSIIAAEGEVCRDTAFFSGAAKFPDRTKSPLADSRAERGRESDIYLVRASAHLCGAFLP